MAKADSLFVGAVGEYLIAIIAQGNHAELRFSISKPLAGHKSEAYILVRAKILRNVASVIFLQKGI
ncbi:hypothetical protein [Thalassospira sp.]|uniref:hypothetical protein n=1 Tax=Thalassospira sp. TaxID=1912094 RepID=UPI003AA81BDC